LDQLDEGKTVFTTLKTEAVAKIKKITISDDVDEGIYEVLTTPPESPAENPETLNFIYKKFFTRSTLEDFIKTNQLNNH
jgi:hypothetical protein